MFGNHTHTHNGFYYKEVKVVFEPGRFGRDTAQNSHNAYVNAKLAERERALNLDPSLVCISRQVNNGNFSGGRSL